MGRVSRWGAAALAVALAGLVTLVMVAAPAEASLTQPFTIRYQTQDRGDILLRGNSLLTCPSAAANCANAINRSATGSALNNNAYAMQYVNTDSDTSTNSSSDARLTLPANASVKFAGLYWSAYTGSNSAGLTAPATGAGISTAKNRLLLKAPGDTSYRTITADPGTVAKPNPVNGPTSDAAYVSFADVTSIVQSAPNGVYTAADIFASTGQGAYAAWTLVVVTRDPSLPRRDLIVFDGFGTIQNSAGDTTQDIPLSNLSTPPSGQIDVRLGTVVFEGDAGLVGDHFQLVPPSNTAVDISDSENQIDNVFNSTNSDAGVEVAGRVPDGNTFGLDADVFQSSTLLGPSATTAKLRFNTGGETYFPAVATFVANSYAPKLDLVRTATVNDTVADGRTRPGDTITYTVTVTNSGDADADAVKITDAIPAGATYLPGSLRVGNTPISDATDSDVGEKSGTNVAVRLGTGANGTSGGTLIPGASSTFSYTVTIADPFTGGGTVGGTSQAAYTDPAGRTFSSTSNTSSVAVAKARADLAVTQTTSPAAIQKTGSHAVTWTVNVKNNGPEAETDPVLVETFPAGVTGITASGATCNSSGNIFTCQLDPLASGGSKNVSFSATLPANATDPTSALASVSGDGTDPTATNNTNTTGVGVNTAPAALPDFAPLNTPDTSTDVDVLSDDTDPDTGDTLTIQSVDSPAHGTASIVTGKIRYTLTDPTFIGTESFDYTVCDNRGGCSPATVNIAVNDHRRADLKVTQTPSPTVVQRGGDLSVTWTAIVTNQGPQDEPNPRLVERLPDGVTGITVTGATCTTVDTTLTCNLSPLAKDGTQTVRFSATLPAGAVDPSVATATLSGTVPDPDPDNNTAAASVGVNRPPVAHTDTPALTADVLSVDIDPTTNDTDPDADPVTITSVTTPAHGTATIVNGKIRYTLTDHSFVGNDTFTYTACDGRGACSDSTVTIAVADHDVADLTVTQTAKPKLLQRDGTRVATWTVTVKNVGPEGNPSPVLTQTLPAGATAISSSLAACTVSGVVATCPMAALASGDSVDITFTATLPANAPDPATASATVSGGSPDPNTADNTAAASVALNTPPVADDEATKLPGTDLKATINVLAGDKDADQDPLTLSSVGKPKHGTAKIVDGKIVYQLTDLDFAGDDSFSYTVCDDRSGCDVAQVTVKVASHLHAPVATADKASVVAGGKVTVDVLANDTDQDGNPLTLRRITGGAVDGTAKVVKGKLVYTPHPGFVGTDTVTYQVCDSTGLCDQATATIKVTATPPIVRPDTANVRPGGTAVVDVLDNDGFPGGNPPASVTIIKEPSTGSASVGKDGSIHYQAPKSAKAGTKVTLRYRVCDTTGACGEGTLSLKIAGAPVNGGALAFTGSRFFIPLTMTAAVLLFAGLLARGLLVQRRLVRARHKA